MPNSKLFSDLPTTNLGDKSYDATKLERFVLSLLNGEQQAPFWAMSPAEQVEFAYQLLTAIRFLDPQYPYEREGLITEAKKLLRKKLPFSNADLAWLVGFATSISDLEEAKALLPGVLTAIELLVGGDSLDAELRSQLLALRATIGRAEGKTLKSIQPVLARIDVLCSQSIASRLRPDDGWADELRQNISSMTEPARSAWEALLRHLSEVPPDASFSGWKVDVFAETNLLNGPYDPEETQRTFARLQLRREPAKAWFDITNEMITGIGRNEWSQQLKSWLSLVPKSRPGLLSRESLNREVLRGLLWCSIQIADAELARLIRTATEFLYASNSALGDAGVQVLFRISGKTAVTELSLLLKRLKYASHRMVVEHAIADIAEQLGTTADALMDETLPTLGFTDVGFRREQLGDFSAELVCDRNGSATLRWLKPDGKEQKSVPAKLKTNFADEVADLKSAVTTVKQTLAIVSDRFEASWLLRRQWEFSAWQQYYLNHPVAAMVTRRLIWNIHTDNESRVCAWSNGSLRTLRNEIVQPSDESQVSLWHPLQSPASDILPWRERLEAEQITQPFKQAHREVYVLTAAEEATQTYSNRFAAHILKQTQLRALAKHRGWTSSYLGQWDSGDRGSAERNYPAWQMGISFLITGTGGEHAPGAGGDLYVATDQVRFHAGNTQTRLPLAEVPPLLLSEAMRDVDLFVAVASVGNDPTWSDGGPDGRHYDYWHNYSFGELAETARTRKAVLERLIPRLRIAPRCSFSDRFLTVRGDLRTYRIHLGSGNILMDPHDQYLCIVPKQAVGDATEDVFLPFEGDNTLSVILSKAFLLADDAQITDPTILSQIRW